MNSGKVFFITGANSGFGRAIALAAADADRANSWRCCALVLAGVDHDGPSGE